MGSKETIAAIFIDGFYADLAALRCARNLEPSINKAGLIRFGYSVSENSEQFLRLINRAQHVLPH
jgi:hypothetical protein